ncbi:retrotransposon gag domain, retroviral aspartyl protease [Tanacetum coccineum]
MAEEETNAKEAKESSYEEAENIKGKESGGKKEKNKQPKVQPKPQRHNRMVKAAQFWKKFVVSTSRTRKGVGGMLGEICGDSWDKQNTQVSISIRLSRGPYKTAYLQEELAKQYRDYYYYLVSTKGIQQRTWDPGIQDHSKQHLEDKVLEANEDVEESFTTDLTNLDSDREETAEISLHAILGKSHPTTMKVHGMLHSTEVLILIDGGSTHNFISDVLVNELKLATQPVSPFGVQIGNGDVIRYGQICKNLPVQINDLKITQDFHRFSLGGADLILGI